MLKVAIIGQSASGKSALCIKIAKELNCNILSLDSLSVYKQINIASAKPSKEQRRQVLHFGIDNFSPDYEHSVKDFIDIYNDAKSKSKQQNKGLVVCGGSSFYLKAILEGISHMPFVSKETKKAIKQEAQNITNDIKSAYENLQKIDNIYAQKIHPNDTYRIQKAYEIILITKQKPSVYFKSNRKIPIDNFPIFELDLSKDKLLENISLRVDRMMQDGLIDEAKYLSSKYDRSLKSLQSIGLKESLMYLDKKISLKECIELINIHTRQLTKRQKTFNKTQFKNITKADANTIQNEIKKLIID